MFGSDWQSEAISVNVFTRTMGVLPANHRHNNINPRYTPANTLVPGGTRAPVKRVGFETRPTISTKNFQLLT